LAALSPEDFSLLARDLKEIRLKQGEVLQERTDEIEQVYFPLSGMISLLAVMKNGTAVEIATIGREGVVCAMVGLGARTAASRAIVQLEGTFARITASKLRAAARQSSAIRELLARYGELLMATISQTAGCNALHPIEARLSRWLLQTRDRSDDDRLSLTQEFLSQMLGVRRTTVTMTARTLQARGLIKYSRGRMEIVDRAGLEKNACECYGFIRHRHDKMFSSLTK